jgi:hypothetical protein
MSHTDRTHPDYFKEIPTWLSIRFMGKDNPSDSTIDQRKRTWRKREWKRDIEMELYS